MEIEIIWTRTYGLITIQKCVADIDEYGEQLILYKIIRDGDDEKFTYNLTVTEIEDMLQLIYGLQMRKYL